MAITKLTQRSDADMGLVITAYSNACLTSAAVYVEGDGIVDAVTKDPTHLNYVAPYVNPDFPGRADEISSRSVYQYERQSIAFKGSYSTYSRFRDNLAKFAGAPDAQWYWDHDPTIMPFYDMIQFSDCEGTLGKLSCERLLRGFEYLQPRLNRLNMPFEEAEEFRKQYLDIMNGLRVAVCNGFLTYN